MHSCENDTVLLWVNHNHIHQDTEYYTTLIDEQIFKRNCRDLAWRGSTQRKRWQIELLGSSEPGLNIRKLYIFTLFTLRPSAMGFEFHASLLRKKPCGRALVIHYLFKSNIQFCKSLRRLWDFSLSLFSPFDI